MTADNRTELDFATDIDFSDLAVIEPQNAPRRVWPVPRLWADYPLLRGRDVGECSRDMPRRALDGASHPLKIFTNALLVILIQTAKMTLR